MSMIWLKALISALLMRTETGESFVTDSKHLRRRLPILQDHEMFYDFPSERRRTKLYLSDSTVLSDSSDSQITRRNYIDSIAGISAVDSDKLLSERVFLYLSEIEDAINNPFSNVAKNQRVPKFLKLVALELKNSSKFTDPEQVMQIDSVLAAISGRVTISKEACIECLDTLKTVAGMD